MHILNNPTIRLQSIIFHALSSSLTSWSLPIDKKRNYDDLRGFLVLCKLSIKNGLELGDELISKWFGQFLKRSETDISLLIDSKKKIPHMVVEMLYDEGGIIKIRELLGSELSLNFRKAISVQEYIDDGHRDLLNIRDTTFAMPQTLRKGDVLSTGYKLLEDPRGIPGDDRDHVLLLVANGGEREWLVVSRSIPVALCSAKDKKRLVLPAK